MLRVMVVVAAVFAVLCAPASADVYDDNPAAVALGPGNVWVFARGDDGTILSRHLSAGAWGDWTAVGGLDAGSGPGAVVLGNSILLFARGQDGAIWQNTLANGAWTGWVSLGGALTSAPSASLRIGTTTIDLAARGQDNSLWHRTLVVGQGWSPWESLGGNIIAAPSLSGFANSGSMDVFVRDAGTNVSWRYWLNGWNSWTGIGGAGKGAPASVRPIVDWLDLYARGNDDALLSRRHDGSANPWQRVNSTALNSSPSATSDLQGRELLFARTADGLSMLTVTNAGTSSPVWGQWSPLGPIALPAPPVQSPVPSTSNPPPVTVTLQTLAPVLSFAFKAFKRETRFSSLTVKAVTAGATVTVKCPKGCSARSFTKRNAKGSVSLARFVKRPLKVGTTLTVVVSRAGAVSSVKTLKVRSRKAPLVTTRCQPPGVAKPQAC